MSTYSIDTRLIGKEDLLLDENGANTQSSYIDPDGVNRPLTPLNASHIPLTNDVRPLVGQKKDVNAAIADLAGQIEEVAQQQTTAMTEDTVIDLSSPTGRQDLIDAQLKNLGGYTLTFKFPSSINAQVADHPLTFTGFYNGTLVVDLNGGGVEDNSALDKEGILRFENCKCAVRVEGNGSSEQGYGTISYSYNHYGVALIHTPDCEFDHVAFYGSNVNSDYAVYSWVSNACFYQCSFDENTKKVSNDSIYKDYTDEHAASSTAHATLFAGKADAVHTHAVSDVTGLQDDLDALDTGKADAEHTHAISDVTNLQTALDGKAASGHSHTIGGGSFSGITFSNVKSAIENIGFLFAGGQASFNPYVQYDEKPVGYEDSTGNKNKGWMILPFYLQDPSGSNLMPIVVEWGVTNTITGGADGKYTQNIPVPVRQVFYVGFTGENYAENAHFSQLAQFIKMTSKTSFQFYNQNVGQYSVDSKHYWFLIGVYGGTFDELPFSYTNPNATA